MNSLQNDNKRKIHRKKNNSVMSYLQKVAVINENCLSFFIHKTIQNFFYVMNFKKQTKKDSESPQDT